MKKAFYGLILLLMLLAIALIFLYRFFFVGTPPPGGNFVVIQIIDDKVAFYQSSDVHFFKLPIYSTSFSVIRKNEHPNRPTIDVWKISVSPDSCGIAECPCNILERRINYSKIIYSEVPDCYFEIIPANELKKETKYVLENGFVPREGKLENVFFILNDCSSEENLCIETNSPISLIDNDF